MKYEEYLCPTPQEPFTVRTVNAHQTDITVQILACISPWKCPFWLTDSTELLWIMRSPCYYFIHNLTCVWTFIGLLLTVLCFFFGVWVPGQRGGKGWGLGLPLCTPRWPDLGKQALWVPVSILIQQVHTTRELVLLICRGGTLGCSMHRNTLRSHNKIDFMIIRLCLYKHAHNYYKILTNKACARSSYL